MPYGWPVAACMVAFVTGVILTAEGINTIAKKRAASGIIFIDNVPYSVRPFNREAPPS